MPAAEETPQEVLDKTLPYKTDDQDVLRLIEAIKRKPDNEKAIREVYNKANFETSRKTLEILSILDERLSFSAEGKELAIEKDDNQREKLFLKFFLRYPPYGHFLESISHNGDLSSTTDTESIKDYWWKHNYGSSTSNREDGIVTFGKLVQLAGLGKFITGRRGQPSRVEWNQNAKSLIDAACSSETNEQILEEGIDSDFNQITDFDSAQVPNNYPLNTHVSTVETREHTEQSSLKGSIPKVIPSISINVDMSEWDTSKIFTFFKAAYGIFENNGESNSSIACSQGFGEPSNGHSDT